MGKFSSVYVVMSHLSIDRHQRYAVRVVNEFPKPHYASTALHTYEQRITDGVITAELNTNT